MIDPSLPVGSPKWWLSRLDDELNARTDEMDRFRDLVDDDHEQPKSAETAAKFRRIAGLATTNLTGLAVEATAERMSIEGIRIGDKPDSDKEFWDNVWQGSDFDAGSQDAITDALVYKRSFISVDPPSAASGGFSRLHNEDPRQVVVAHAPDGKTRVAALKRFVDEWTGEVFATLYLPSTIVRMRRQSVPGLTDVRWLARDLDPADSVVRNPFGVVPFFELQNKLTGRLRSEVAPLETPQKRLNQIIFNTDAVAEYGAFRQKWATGIEVPVDPVTNKRLAPFEAGADKLFAAPGDAVKFGDFNVTDMDPYIRLAQDVAAHMARISRVPVTYFLSNVSNLSAEALALLVSGLVLKCQRRVKGYEPAIEGAVRLALRAQNDPRAAAPNIEAKWADMETRSRAQDADAAVKLTQGDNPVVTPQTAQEKYLGMSQTERDRDDAWRRRERGTNVLEQIRNARASSGDAPQPAA